MVIIAVKCYCTKNGRKYGPYPKDPDLFYLYRVYRDGKQVKREYLGKGTKKAAERLNDNLVVQEGSR